MTNELTQTEADALIKMEKIKGENKEYHYPSLGGRLDIPLYSKDKTESFILDLWRGSIQLTKNKIQTRARHSIILVRIDLGGSPHRNPDGTEVASPHIHIYRENYGDKWAEPLPISLFPNPTDTLKTVYDFLQYCNVTDQPSIHAGVIK